MQSELRTMLFLFVAICVCVNLPHGFGQEVTEKQQLAILLDLGRESVCNNYSNLDLPVEGIEAAQQAAKAAQWTLEKMKASAIDINISLRLVDTCGSLGLTISRALSLSSEYGLITPVSNATFDETHHMQQQQSNQSGFCGKSSVLISSLYGSQVKKNVNYVLPDVPVFVPPREEWLEEQSGALALVKRLGWNNLVLVSDNPLLFSEFGNAAEREDVCIVETISFNTNRSNDLATNSRTVLDLIGKSRSSNVLVFSSRSSRILQLIGDEGVSNSTNKQLDLTWIIIVPSMNTKMDDEAQLLPINPNVTKNVYIVESQFLRAPEFMYTYRNLSAHTSRSVEDPCTFQVIRTVLGLVNMMRQNKTCSIAIPSSNDVRKKLGLTLEERKFSIHVANATNQTLVYIGKYSLERGLELLLSNSFKKAPFSDICLECKCVNLDPIPARVAFRWRYDTWVTIMSTLGCLGVVTSVALGIFLASKSCTEVLDGSQATSLLLLFAVILTYAALVPYSLTPNNLICALRSMCTRLAYTGLFAVLLSRSIMLASADYDGLPGHISGRLQLCLLIFIVGVQVALVVQEWFLQPPSSYTFKVLVGRVEMLECHRHSGGCYDFFVHMSYVMFLLALQLVISPWIVRSTRNYKEGLLFTFASFSCLFVWIGWAAAYVMLEDRFGANWHDIAVCCGLVATPTVLNLVIFIPKCYLMAFPGSSYKGSDAAVNLHGLVGSTNEMLSRSTSSRLSQAGEVTPGGAFNLQQGTTRTCSTIDEVLMHPENNALAAIGANDTGRTNYHHVDLYDTLKAQSRNRPYASEQPRQRSSIAGFNNLGVVGKSSSRLLSSGLHNGDTLESNEYPTFKLDENTVVDTSISWQRYSFPSSQSHRIQQQQVVGIPNPPPVPPLRSTTTKPSRNLVV